jgi:hypothetical protein
MSSTNKAVILLDSTDDILVGQRVSADSIPVTVASDQPAIAVSMSTSPLPTGAATEATLSSLLTSSQLLDDVIYTAGTSTYTEAASKGSLILGIRRDADTSLVDTTNEMAPLQVDANGRLKVEAFSGETLPVSLTSTTITGTVAVTKSGTWTLDANSGVDIGDVTINNASGAGAVNIQDGGNSITVDGTIAATQSGTWSTRTQDGSGNNITSASRGSERALSVQIVDGSGTQITSFGGGTQYTEDIAAAADPIGNMLLVVRADSLASITDSDGDNLALRATNKGELYVKQTDAIPVTDNAGSLTVDNGGTFAVQESGAALTSLQLIDDIVGTAGSAITSKAGVVAGSDGTTTRIISTTATGIVKVDLSGTNANSTAVKVDGSSFTQPVSGTVTANLAAGTNNIGDVDVLTVPAPLSTTGNGTAATALRVTVASDSTGVLAVTDNGGSLTVDGTVAATQSGTWNITNISGTVSLPTGAATLSEQQTQTTSLQLLDDVVVVDNAAFTDGTTKLSMAGYIYDDVAGTALSENDAAAARINSNRALVNTIEDGATRGRYATVTASNAIKVDGSAVTQPISASSLPLPTGAATETTLTGVLTTSAFQARVNTLGQKTMANSTPVVVASDQTAIPSSQSGAWTVTANAGTNLNTSALALESGGNLASVVTNTTNIPNVIGTAASAIPSKLIQVGGSDGTNARAIRTNTSGQLDIRPLTNADVVKSQLQDNAGNGLTSNSTTYTAKFALDENLLGTLGTAFSTPGKVDIKGADGDVFVRQATASNLNATVVGTGTFAVQAAQSGTWTVQPGNTANTTAWLVTGTGGTFPVTDSGGSLTVDNNGTFAVQASIAAGATSIAKAEDVASANADVGVPAMAVRKAVPANTSDTDGDYEMLQLNRGRLWTTATVDALPAHAYDIFGKIRISEQFNDVEVQFHRDSPANLVTITAAGTPNGTADNTTVPGLMQMATGTGTTGEIKAVTKDSVIYRSGAEVFCMFTAAWLDGGVATSFQRIGLYDTSNGFFIGYENTTFGVTTRTGAVDTQVAKASWSVDTLTGASTSKFTRNGTPEAIDLTKLNVFRVRYGWLGSAPIRWEVLSPDGEWVLFHQTLQPNLSASPSVQSTDLPITAHLAKTAGATSLRLNTACWGAGINYSDVDFAASATLATAANSAVNFNTLGVASLRIRIGTTTTGTIALEATVDGTNWITHPNCYLTNAAGSGETQVTSTITPTSGNAYRLDATGFRGVRARTATTLGASVVIAYLQDTHVSIATVIGDKANNSAAPGSTNVGALVAVANASVPTFTEGNIVALSSNLSGAVRTVPFEVATYSATNVNYTVASSATDIFTITGSGSKTVRVRRMGMSGIQTTAGQGTVILLKRSTANTGGTATTCTNVPYDSTSAAATAVVRAYTANPTTGTLVGNLYADRLFIGTATSNSDRGIWEFNCLKAQPLVLRGTGEVLSINLNGITASGNVINAWVEWTEE